MIFLTLHIQVFKCLLLFLSLQGLSRIFWKRSKLHLDESSTLHESSETLSNSNADKKTKKKRFLSFKSFKVIDYLFSVTTF